MVSVSNDLHNIGDFGATLGGYIIKDRIWFFVGVQPSFQRYWTRHYSQARLDAAATRPPTRPLATSSTTRSPTATSAGSATRSRSNFIGKLTFLLSSDHRLSISVNGTPTTGGGGGVVPNRARERCRRETAQRSAIFGGGTFKP